MKTYIHVYRGELIRGCDNYHTNIAENFFFLIKPTDALISQFFFCQETLHVSGSSSAHHQGFSTVRSTLVYVMQV